LTRSQGILVAVGLAALAAMAAPYLTRAVVDSRAVSGKVQVFQDHSYRPQKDLVLCLIRQPGALALKVASNDLYTSEASGLAVKVTDKHDFREVRAWLPAQQRLTADQTAQLSECIARAPEVKVN
jgi:hypothetical protein